MRGIFGESFVIIKKRRIKGNDMEMKYFWIMIISAAVLVGLGWIAYAIWEYRERKIEESQPKVRSEKLTQTQNQMAEYAKKLAEFKKPTYKKEDVNPERNENKQ